MDPSIPDTEAELVSAGALLESQVREVFGRVVYTHKTHEKCADASLRHSGQIKFLQIVLSAITAGSFLVDVFGEGRLGTLIGSILATILLGLSTYTKDHDLGELAQKHSDTARKLWGVRESYLSLLTDISSGTLGRAEAVARRDELQKQAGAIYDAAPRTDAKSYAAAQKALKVDEDLTFSDREIDAFLPKALQRGPNGQAGEGRKSEQT